MLRASEVSPPQRTAVRSCGLDFGTSNSTVALVRGGRPELAPVEGDKPTIPSAVFFPSARKGGVFGRAAIAAYTDGEQGRFMRAIKSILGQGLFHEKTPIQGRQVALSYVLKLFLAHLKQAAETCAGEAMDDAVLGRPVQFIEDDTEADARAQEDLAQAARAVGFRHIAFQYEPIAAALDYELTVGKEELVFVVDIGGGTADFSIVRVSPEKSRKSDRRGDILANRGVRVGGTDFDSLLSLTAVMPLFGLGSRTADGKAELPKWIYHELSTWSQIAFLYSQKVRSVLRGIRYDAERGDLVDRLIRVIEHQEGHRIIDHVEGAKIQLSEARYARIDLDSVEPGLAADIDRDGFERAILPGLARIEKAITATAVDAGLDRSAIEAVFLTGGSSAIPILRKRVSELLPNARLSDGDMFGSVGKGLGLDAHRKFG
ncbi:MAG TPA: Hsp70 family protein [Xanthobacteraceae bacterium]|nr:Hsp70 family protein [Xanthobacteraceae bacterium]